MRLLRDMFAPPGLIVLLLLGMQAGPGHGDGSAAGLAQWQGRWVVVNYWAEWCPPCRDEIPELNALHEAREDVTVLGVNFDRLPEAELSESIERMAIEFPVLAADPHEALGVARPSVIPTTFLIDPDGAVAKRLKGPHSREQLEQALESAASQ